MKFAYRNREDGFWRSERGASAVEFALVSLPLIAFLLFSIQAVVIYFADAALETFSDDVARGMLTGQTQQLALTAPMFKVSLCSKLPSLFSCDHLWVDVAAYADFTALATSTPSLNVGANGNVLSDWGFNPGSKGSVVVVRMAYMWPVVGMPLGGLGNISSTVHQMTVNSVLRTELYQ